MNPGASYYKKENGKLDWSMFILDFLVDTMQWIMILTFFSYLSRQICKL